MCQISFLLKKTFLSNPARLLSGFFYTLPNESTIVHNRGEDKDKDKDEDKDDDKDKENARGKPCVFAERTFFVGD